MTECTQNETRGTRQEENDSRLVHRLTPSCLRRWHDVLRLVKCRQTVIGDLQNPPRVDHAIARREIAVYACRGTVKVFHALHRRESKQV